jgi:ABC-type nitrate/sulfonate/bicarbonate transport system substrate-binding protein
VLKANGVDANDVELVNFTTAGDVVTAITRGDVDAYLGSSFDLLPSLNSGEVKQIADITGYPAITYLIGTNAFIEKYPELTQKLVQAVNEGAEYIENNKEEVYPILAEQAGMDADTLNQLFPDIDMNTEFTDDDLTQIKNTEQFLIDNDLISEPIENLESEHINTTFIDKVLKGE